MLHLSKCTPHLRQDLAQTNVVSTIKPRVGYRGTHSTLRVKALPEWFRQLLDFESWAPRSTRIWRLQQFDIPEAPKKNPDAEAVEELQARANELSRENLAAKGAAVPKEGQDQDFTGPMKSFSEADDDELAQAFKKRLETIESGSDSGDDLPDTKPGAEMAEKATEEGEEEEEDVEPLTGQEMMDLLMTKYGRLYDVSFVRRDIPGKSFVCLNIMWQYMGQRSFKLSKEQYEDKVDSVAYLLNVLGQTDNVRGFLQAPARSEKGLPRRPVVGTAISVQLDLAPDVVSDFFGQGYQ